MQVVIDASFAAAWFLPDEKATDADGVLEAVFAGDIEMSVPYLWVYEMSNLFISAHRRGRLHSDQVVEAQALVTDLPRTTYEHQRALSQRRLVRIASKQELSAYDAAYLELANRLQCPLYTQDGALEAAARRLGLNE